MKKNCFLLLALLSIPLFYANKCNAQINTIGLKPAPPNIIIDGNLTEWGDSLSYYSSETGLNYTFAADKNNLYLVLKTNDPVEQSKILNWGLTLGIDTKGKKKETYTVTFPVQEQTIQAFSSSAADKKLEAGLTKLRKIKVDGFKDVEYDLITLENTYGFKMAVNYDTHGFLVYEEMIPLALFHADDKKAEWMFNIKINGFQKPERKDDKPNAGASMGSGSRGGRGGGGRGGAGGGGGRGGRGGRADTSNDTDRSDQSTKSSDFWGKFAAPATQ